MKRGHLYQMVAMVAMIALLSSCSTPKDIAYFQDFNMGKSIVVQNPVEIKFKADDEIRVMVSSDKPELESQFSLHAGGDEGGSRYTIDSEGCIRFPLLGKIHVAGLNRQELQEVIRDQIMERDPRYVYLYQIRPGITSMATLYNGYTDTMEKMLKRLEMDLDYLKNRSWWLDAKILGLTFLKIVFGRKI